MYDEDEDFRKFRTDEKGGKTVRFDPPLYIQRYDRVIRELRKYSDVLDRLVDFGSAECKFLRRARNKLSDYVRSYIGVDTDGELLEKSVAFFKSRTDMENETSERPRTVTSLYKGSIAEYDDRLLNVDAVVAIELIEHLDQATLSAFPSVIFERIQPYIVIFTTPNVEFNVLFDMGDRKFRHWDHKFEWTRKEFQDWCSMIIQRYPHYAVTFDGVGHSAHSDDRDLLGPCSQMAIFRYKDKKTYYGLKEQKLQLTKHRKDNVEHHLPYQLISRVIDEPKFTKRRKCRIFMDCQTYCNDRLDEAVKQDQTDVWVSFKELLGCSEYVRKICQNVETLKYLLLFRDEIEDWRIRIDLINGGVICYNDTTYEESDNSE